MDAFLGDPGLTTVTVQPSLAQPTAEQLYSTASSEQQAEV